MCVARGLSTGRHLLGEPAHKILSPRRWKQSRPRRLSIARRRRPPSSPQGDPIAAGRASAAAADDRLERKLGLKVTELAPMAPAALSLRYDFGLEVRTRNELFNQLGD